MKTSTLEKLHHDQVTRAVNVHVGDTVKVHYKIKEGGKDRIQIYEGIVIAIRNQGAGKSIVVRRISYDVGVERIFPVYSPTVEKIEKVRSSKVRRSKLYYQRSLSGKESRLTEVRKAARVDSVYDKVEKKRSAKAKAAAESAPESSAAEATTTESAQS